MTAKEMVEDFTTVSFDNGEEEVSAEDVLEEYQDFEKISYEKAASVAKQVNAKLAGYRKMDEEE